MSAQENKESTEQPHLLEYGTTEGPASDATKVQVDGGKVSLYDQLGPLVRNSDGTLSRIGNWQEMGEKERARLLGGIRDESLRRTQERTLRILSKRNLLRYKEQTQAGDKTNEA